MWRLPYPYARLSIWRTLPFSQLFASMPHAANRKLPEGTFEDMMLIAIRLFGFKTEGERSAGGGDVDIVIELEEKFLSYAIELKVGTTQTKQCSN